MMFNLSIDQAVATMLAIAIGAGAGAWLWWLGSARRAEYAAVEARNQLRIRAKRIQAEIRMGGSL